MVEISTGDKEKITTVEAEFGVKMSKSEYEYLESQMDSKIPRSDGRKV